MNAIIYFIASTFSFHYAFKSSIYVLDSHVTFIVRVTPASCGGRFIQTKVSVHVAHYFITMKHGNLTKISKRDNTSFFVHYKYVFRLTNESFSNIWNRNSSNLINFIFLQTFWILINPITSNSINIDLYCSLSSYTLVFLKCAER